MTATLPASKAGLGIQQAKDRVMCPVCEEPTGTLDYAGPHGLYTRLFPNAAGYEDGARCKEHARSRALRSAQSRRALAWIDDEDLIAQLVHE